MDSRRLGGIEASREAECSTNSARLLREGQALLGSSMARRVFQIIMLMGENYHAGNDGRDIGPHPQVVFRNRRF